MPYRKRIFIYPGGKEVQKYFTCRLGGKKTRAKNQNKTPKDVAQVNFRRAVRNLKEIILTNFTRGDYYITLTYTEEPTYEEAKKHLSNFMKRLRRRHKKKGQELYGISTTEYKGERLHHHILINRCLSQDEIRDCWGHAQIRYNFLSEYQGEEEDARKLAEYFCKEHKISPRGDKQKVRYNATRNLKKPEVHYRTIHSKKWKENPTPQKGYIVQEVLNTFTVWGYPMQIAKYQKAGFKPPRRHNE